MHEFTSIAAGRERRHEKAADQTLHLPLPLPLLSVSRKESTRRSAPKNDQDFHRTTAHTHTYNYNTTRHGAGDPESASTERAGKNLFSPSRLVGQEMVLARKVPYRCGSARVIRPSPGTVQSRTPSRPSPPHPCGVTPANPPFSLPAY